MTEEKDPIEIGRTRRPMECVLTDEERQVRSNQVHSEIEVKEQRAAERDTLAAQAASYKEQAKAVEEAIKQLDLKIRDLSQAARTGRETRPVDVLKLYDPTKGEIIEKRDDTGEVMPLRRKPTAQEWDAINEAMQTPLAADDGTPFTEPPPKATTPDAPTSPSPTLRDPLDVPGMDKDELKRMGAPETWAELGRHIGQEDRGFNTFSEGYVAEVLRTLTADADKPISLTAGELAELSDGLCAGLAGEDPPAAPLTEQVKANIAALYRSPGWQSQPEGTAVTCDGCNAEDVAK